MSNCKLSGKGLVIQIDRDETRIALTTLGQAMPQIQHCVTLPTPANAVEDGMIHNVEAMRELLKTALKVPEFKGVRKAVFSLCTTQVITETVTTPNVAGSKLEKLLQANMDMYFPVDVKDYQVVWQTVGPKAGENALGEQAVQLWAVPRDVLARYYALANGCGLSVQAIDYCGHSAATAAGASFATGKVKKERKTIDLNKEISFGRKKTEEGKTEKAKTETAVAVATGPVSDTELHLNLEQEHLMMTFVQGGQVKLQRVMQCGTGPSEQLGEAMMVLEYYRAMDMGGYSEIRGVFSGRLADDAGLTAEIEDALGIPGTCAPNGVWALCLGAAGTNLDFGDPEMNRVGKAKSQAASQLWQYLLILVGGAALVAALVVTMGSRVNWNSDIASLESREMDLRIEAQKNAGFANNYRDYENAYNSYVNDRETVFANLRTYNDNLVLMLDEIEGIVPETTSVTQIGIAANGLTLQFACPSKEEAAYLIMALRELQYADLLAISNLTGGGAGASAPILPQGGNEEAPTEGSSSLVDQLLQGSVSKEELIQLVTTLTPEEIEAFESTYGAQPTVSNTLESLNATFDQRKASLDEMLSGNPFAVYRFIELLQDDMLRPAGTEILYDYISADLMKSENQQMFLDIISGSIKDPATMRDYQIRLIAMLVKDEDTLTATENLMATDPVMLDWYIYYLEVQTGVRTAEEFPYLNISKILSDMVDGTWPNTGNESLDAKLEAVLPTIPGLGGDPDPGPGTDPNPGPGTDPNPGPGTNPDPGPGTDPNPGPGTDPNPGPGTDPNPGPGTDPNPGPGTEIDYAELIAKYPALVNIAVQNPELAKKLAADSTLVNFLIANEGIIEMLEKNPSLVDPIISGNMTTQQIIDYLNSEYAKYTAGQNPGTEPTPGPGTDPDPTPGPGTDPEPTPGPGTDPEPMPGPGTDPGDEFDLSEFITKYPGLFSIALQNPELAKKLAGDTDLLNFLMANPGIIDMLEKNPGMVTPIIQSNLTTPLIIQYLQDMYAEYTSAGNPSGDGSYPDQEPQDTRIYFTVTLGYRQDLIEAELLRRGLDRENKLVKMEVME